MSEVAEFDALVVGAGIAGTSVAYFMSPHAKVCVLEREPFAGMHSTGRSAALFSETYGPPQVQALTRASRSFLERPPQGFTDSPILSPRGALIIAPDAQVRQIEAEFDAIRSHLRHVRLLDEKENRNLVPVLLPEFARVGIFEPRAADIDVHSLHQGFIRGLKAHGSDLQCGVEIRAIERVGSHWNVETATGRMRAPLLINAAGAWADELAALAGVEPLGLQPRRRSAFLFTPPPDLVTAQWPFVCAVDESFYFKPDAGLLLGSPANADPAIPHDVQPEELDIATGIHRIEQATTLRIQRPTRTWAGLRSFLPDGNLVAGFAPDSPGFFWVAALGGYGIQTSAAVGAAGAQLALGRSLPPHLSDQGLSVTALAVRRSGQERK
jgi:D-arginine dehydrogenase